MVLRRVTTASPVFLSEAVLSFYDGANIYHAVHVGDNFKSTRTTALRLCVCTNTVSSFPALCIGPHNYSTVFRNAVDSIVDIAQLDTHEPSHAAVVICPRISSSHVPGRPGHDECNKRAQTCQQFTYFSLFFPCVCTTQVKPARRAVCVMPRHDRQAVAVSYSATKDRKSVV